MDGVRSDLRLSEEGGQHQPPLLGLMGNRLTEPSGKENISKLTDGESENPEHFAARVGHLHLLHL